MTQLSATFQLLIERYPEAVSHAEGMDKVGLAFRSRCSDLRLDYGIGVTLEFHRPESQGYYRLTDTPQSALEKLAQGRLKTPDRPRTRGILPKPFNNALNDSGGNLRPTLSISEAGRKGGIKSGEVRRVGAKGVRIGGRMMAWSVYRKELAQKKQEKLTSMTRNRQEPCQER